MSSILADIDTTLENSGEDWLALHYLMCYFGYCNDEHLPNKSSPSELFSSTAFIELPDKYLLKLDNLGLIKSSVYGGQVKPSVYFYDKNDWFTPNINTFVISYNLDQRVLDEYVKFHNMPQEYKTEAIKNFLHEMKDYIITILQNYYDNLAKCC